MAVAPVCPPQVRFGCEHKVVCRRLPWEVAEGGPPMVQDGHILCLTWRRAKVGEASGQERVRQEATTPAAMEGGDLGMWCDLDRQQMLRKETGPQTLPQLRRWAKEEVWAHLMGSGVQLPGPPIMTVREEVWTGVVSVELRLPVVAARQAMCGSGRYAGVGFRPHLGAGAALELGYLLERVAVPEEAQRGM